MAFRLESWVGGQASQKGRERVDTSFTDHESLYTL